MATIKDLIPFYPNITDKKFAYDITRLKEVYTLRLDKDENAPDTAGVPMKHQTLETRYVSPFTKFTTLLLWHGVGAGKTALMAFVQENFVEILRTDPLLEKSHKRALILVKNSSLREAFRKEIAEKATKNKYLPDIKPEEDKEGAIVDLSIEAQTKRVNAAIDKIYEIKTFGELLSNKNFPSDAIIKSRYSNRNVFVDEPSGVREAPGSGEARIYYANLHKFLHVAENIRIVLSTASPIWDKTYDIAGTFNLILPLDKQMPTGSKFFDRYFDSNFKLKADKISELLSIFRGKVSYVRPLISSAVKREIGVREPWTKYVTVYPSKLSKYQSLFAQEAIEKIKTEEEIRKKKMLPKNVPLKETDMNQRADSFASQGRDATNCVYPTFKGDTGVVSGGSYGLEAFETYAVKKTQSRDVKGNVVYNESYRITNKHLRKALGPSEGKDRFESLRKYATKFATIIEMLLDKNRSDEKGYIYIDSVRGTGGCVSLALIMELWGFTWIKNLNTINVTIPDARNNPRPDRAVSPGSFFVITSDPKTISKRDDIKKAINIFNLDENRYGKMVRIIIGSKATSIGYTFKAVRQHHSCYDPWNWQAIDQGEGRDFRTGSHNQLPSEERYINYYRHVALEGVSEENLKPKNEGKKWVRLPKGLSSPDGGVFSTEKTLDIHIYGIAEAKEYPNSQIYRLMKMASWDCSVNYKRNVLPIDVNGSRECDFVDCNYKCDSFPTPPKTGEKFVQTSQGRLYDYSVDELDISSINYNLLYSKQDVINYTKRIVSLFGSYFVLKLEMVMLLLNAPQTEETIVLQSLSNIVNRKILIRNRYGFGCYLKECGDSYFLDPSTTSTSVYMTSIYSIFPLVNERVSLEESVEIIQLKRDIPKIKEFSNTPTNELFATLSYKTKVLLAEMAVVTKEKTKGTDIDLSTADNDPSTDIIYKNMRHNIYEFIEDGTNKRIIAHVMYNTEYTGAAYDSVAQNLKPNGKMRVFDTSANDGWNFVNPSSELAYIQKIRERMDAKKKVGMENNPYKIYGIDEPKFKIFDGRKENARTGKVCDDAGYSVEALIDIFHHIKHLPYDDEVTPDVEGLSSNDLIEVLKTSSIFTQSDYISEVEEMSLDELKSLYTLFHMKKGDMCKSLERWFKGENSDKKSYCV